MSEIKNFLLDLIFPRRCLGCNQLMSDFSDAYVCDTCLAMIPLKTDLACAFCFSPTTLGQTCPFCRREHQLDRLLVATGYETPLVEKMLKALKYKFVKSLSDQCAQLMVDFLENNILDRRLLVLDKNNLIATPVPLHRRRQNWRGFNQSEIIAEKVSQYFGWQFEPNLLKRVKSNQPQADITDRASRVANASGIFSCPNPSALGSKLIILIDDVSTTGSTLDDCARALKGAGAKEVIALVFARGK